MERFRMAASVRPGDPAALYQVGALELQLGRTEEAREVLEQVAEKAPEFAEAHVSLATVYYRLKRKEDGDRHRAIAEKLSEKAQEQQPGAQAGGAIYRGEAAPGPTGVDSAETKEKPTP
jgi:tetratricopeptide (TPR) repeat protein